MRNSRYFILFFLTCFSISTTTIGQGNASMANYEEIRITWNQILKNRKLYKNEPTTLLVETVKNLEPGKALDVAMGTGRNAIYLSKQGWSVTGFDISDEAIDSAKIQASREGVLLETVVTPAEYFDFGANKWDLISFLYADIICDYCLGNDLELIERLKQSLKPGGLLVYEWFTIQGVRDINQNDTLNIGCPENITKQAFDKSGGFEYILYEEGMGVPDWDPSYSFNPVKLIYMVIRKL